jgi:hypothetical protein
VRVTWLVLPALGLGVAGLLAVADRRWRARSAGLVEQLMRGVFAGPPAVLSLDELDGLPSPVARYFRAVLRDDGQPVIRRVRLGQHGEFLLRPPGGWRPFRATQHVVTRPAGFVWDARIRLLPGLAVRVRDALVDRTGHMHASVGGVFTVALVEGTPGIAAGALHRYLAEAVWFPTALLPSAGVIWTPIDDSTARATLAVGDTTVSLGFSFGPDGLVRSVFTPARARDVGGRAVPTPWRGRFSAYEARDGMRIPLSGEVEWILPEGPQVYWRGRITDMRYEYDRLA